MPNPQLKELPIRYLFITALIAGCFLQGVGARELTYAPLPLENPRQVMTQSQPLVKYLEMGMGQEVTVRLLAHHGQVVSEFAEGNIDLALLGPLPVMALWHMEVDAVPLVFFHESDGTPAYTCAIAVPFDGHATLAELTGETEGPFALTHPLSTCGYFATYWQLQRAGAEISALPHAFLGNHEDVALALARGHYAAGGLKTTVARRYAHIGVRILAESPPLPGFSLVANARTMNAEQMEAIRHLLLDIPPDTLHSFLLGRFGFSPSTREDFLTMEQMLRELGMPMEYYLEVSHE